jgi:hypothetical protein
MGPASGRVSVEATSATSPDHPRPHQPEVARAPRAERVLAALQHFARGGVVCELPSTIARWLGESVDTVQRGIRDLIAAGRLERTPMRHGKATAFRLVESPQLEIESPQRAAAAIAAEESSLRDSSAAQSHRRSGPDFLDRGAPESPKKPWNQSPMQQTDREHLDNFEWTPELLADYAERARRQLECFSGGDRLAHLEATEDGECGDCHQQKPRRRYGSFLLCTVCSTRRCVAEMRVASSDTHSRGAYPPSVRCGSGVCQRCETEAPLQLIGSLFFCAGCARRSVRARRRKTSYVLEALAA